MENKELWTVLGSIVGVISALIVLIKYVLKEYFKLVNNSNGIKHSNEIKAIEELEKVINEHKKDLRMLQEQMKDALEKLNRNYSTTEAFIASLTTYIQSNSEKTKQIESKLIKLSDDLVMLKRKFKN